MKIICIRQPGYLPNIGFFQKFLSADVFVYLDDVNYGSEGWDNRNKIRSDKESMFLTVPIVRKTKKILNEIYIANNLDWKKKHLRSIDMHYHKTPYFDKYWSKLKTIIEKKTEKLIELNLEIIEWIRKELDIETDTIKSSELEINQVGNDKLLRICEKLNATTYLSGIMGKNYLNEDIFFQKNIEILYDNFQHPVYKQIHGGFIPNMSIIDLLFNEGDNAKKIIKNSII